MCNLAVVGPHLPKRRATAYLARIGRLDRWIAVDHIHRHTAQKASRAPLRNVAVTTAAFGAATACTESLTTAEALANTTRCEFEQLTLVAFQAPGNRALRAATHCARPISPCNAAATTSKPAALSTSFFVPTGKAAAHAAPKSSFDPRRIVPHQMRVVRSAGPWWRRCGFCVVCWTPMTSSMFSFRA